MRSYPPNDIEGSMPQKKKEGKKKETLYGKWKEEYGSYFEDFLAGLLLISVSFRNSQSYQPVFSSSHSRI